MKKTLIIVIVALISNLTFSQETLDVFDIARKGTLEQAKNILKVNPNAFNTVNEDGFSPLILACYKGNNEVAKLLIETGCDINGNSKMGTPLMACVVKGNNEIAKFLIKKKVDIDNADANGTTALIYCVQFNNKIILSLLLENKVDKTHKDKDGKTAFEHAVFSGNEEIINLLK
jgi:ankyrin repeat protein